MPRKASQKLAPELIALAQALARSMVAQQQREEVEAATAISELRSILGLENDFTAWKRRVEGLMRAFYKFVPHALSVSLLERIQGVTTAVRELGIKASGKRIALRAGELTIKSTSVRAARLK